MRAEGASYKEIHKVTRIFGATNSYASMFRNKTYLGILKCGELEVEGAIEALVTPELWKAVQKTLHRRPKRGKSWPKGKQHPRRVSSPFLLSGLARCIYCGSAVSGGKDNVHTRPNPWPYYLCGRKKRQSYDSCEGRKVGARPVEEAVLQAVLNQVLTPTFIEELIEAVNVYLGQDLTDLDQRIKDTRQRLLETRQAIENLLDLAEQFGARSAVDRLAMREGEQEQLYRELQSLEARRNQRNIEVSPEAVLSVIADAREGLTSEDIQAQRTLLSKFVNKVEIGNKEGRLWYAFPLQKLPGLTGLWLVPPRGCNIKHRIR